jgi:sigma-E factor negative regulatory protein RseC
MKNSFVSHSGFIQKISESDIEVMIISESACSACKSKKVCTVSGMKEKVIHLKPDKQLFHPGEKVQVVMEEKTGFYATILAYIGPFVVMMSVLLVGTSLKMSEPLMGILVIVFLVIYFFILSLFRKRFEKMVSFIIRKQNNE